ncbi:hypothetical protein Tco_0072875 [Tanacetum coccineum]
MSDSEDFIVTYTAISSPFEGLSDIRSPGVDGPPMMPEDPYAYVVAAFQAPPSSDYVPGLEDPDQVPPLPEFVPESAYPKFMPLEDDVLPAEEQTTDGACIYQLTISPGFIPESDLEEDDDEDPEEDPVDYPTDRDDDDEEEEEEEEHPAPADSISPPPVRHTTTRISIPAQAPVPFLSEEEVERPTPPPSPLTLLSSPLPQIPSPPLPASPPVPVSSPPPPASPTYSAPMAMMMAATPSTYTLAPPLGTQPLLPILLPMPSPHLLLPSTDHRANMPEVCLPPRKRLCIAQGPRYEVGESSSAPRPTGGFRIDYGFVATLDAEIRRDPERDVGYGITNTWDEMLVGMPGAPATDDTELGRRMTEFATMVRQDTYEIYGRLDEVQDARAVLSGRLNLIQRDRRSHVYTALRMEREARLSHEAWGRSMDASDATRYEVMALRTTILGQQADITALRAADRA